MIRLHAFLLILVCVTCSISCNNSGYVYEIPEQTNDGWHTGSLDNVGIEQQRISSLIDHIQGKEYQNIHSILIVKDEMLVLEEYFDGYRFNYDDEQLQGEFVKFDADTTHNLMSVTKAITAALVGIAIDQGYIQDVDERVFDLFPQYSYLQGEGKDAISLEHLLTMTSGLQWNEWDVPLTTPENDLIQLFIVSDPVAYILSKDLIHQPGSYWYYSGGDVNLLGEAFKNATGWSIDDFAKEYLFSPLGVTEYEWKHINPQVVYTSGELALRPRDMAKFGYLYLSDGLWDGKRVISSEWIENSIQEHVTIEGGTSQGDGYGYQWFLKTYTYDSSSIRAVVRTGWGGQAIVLFPSINMMVVLTGGDYIEQDNIDSVITQFILPSIK